MDGKELIIGEGGELITALGRGEIGDIIKPLVSEIHLFDTFVAGTTFLDDQTVLSEIKVDDKLTLVRENNKYDDNAIMIITSDKKKLGYVPEKDNVIFARLMDAGKMLMANIKAIDHKGSFTQITIGIFLVDF